MSFKLRLCVLLSIILFVACVWLIGGIPRESAVPVAEVSTIPPYTPEIAAQLEKSKGFQAFVSYTDRGFEPASATIKKGNTVRFTNNSSRDLWITANGAPGNNVYPGTACGATAFDTCKVLKPLDFWEFTFDKNGTWNYQNLENNENGVVIVE